MPVDKEGWESIGLVAKWMAADKAEMMPGGMHVSDFNPKPADMDEVKNSVPPQVRGQVRLIDAVKLADDAADGLVDTLVLQHLAAAKATVEPPTAAEVKKIRKGLEDVSAQLKANQTFVAISTLAGALAKVIKNA